MAPISYCIFIILCLTSVALLNPLPDPCHLLHHLLMAVLLYYLFAQNFLKSDLNKKILFFGFKKVLIFSNPGSEHALCWCVPVLTEHALCWCVPVSIERALCWYTCIDQACIVLMCTCRWCWLSWTSAALTQLVSSHVSLLVHSEHVCLSVCDWLRAYLQNYAFNLHHISCARYLLPWLCPSSAALR